MFPNVFVHVCRVNNITKHAESINLCVTMRNVINLVSSRMSSKEKTSATCAYVTKSKESLTLYISVGRQREQQSSFSRECKERQKIEERVERGREF